MLWDWCHGLTGFIRRGLTLALPVMKLSVEGRAAVVIMQEKRAVKMSQQPG